MDSNDNCPLVDHAIVDEYGHDDAIIHNSNMASQVGIIETNQQVVVAGLTQQTFKLTKQRWLVLFAMTLYGLISSATGDFSAILDIMLKLLDLPLDSYIYIGQLFMYLPVLSTMPTTWFVDKYGLKIVMYVATLFMLIRSGFRALLFYPDSPNWEQFKILYWVLSGLAASQSASIFFCMPLKISENWFPESERSIAWTLMISSYGLGVTLAAFAFPRFIHQVSDVKPLAYFNFVGGIVASIVILLCITKSKPKYPPSERTIKSSEKKIPWLVSIKKMVKQRDIVLHILHEVIYDGLILAPFAVIQDILIASGHSKIFVGNIIAINSLLFVVLLVVLAAIVHRITDITTTCKVASVLRSLIFIIHLLTMLYPMADWIVLLVSVIYTTFKAWALPNNNNMTAHLVSGTVSEATIAGVSATAYVISVTICQVAFVKLIRKDSMGNSDYTYSITMASIVCVIDSLVYILFFKGEQAKSDDRLDHQVHTNGAQTHENSLAPHNNQTRDGVALS